MKRSVKLIVVASLVLNVLLVAGIVGVLVKTRQPKPEVEELGGGFTLETTVVDRERDIRDIVLYRDGMVITKIVAEKDSVVSIMPTPRASCEVGPEGYFIGFWYARCGPPDINPVEVTIGSRGELSPINSQMLVRLLKTGFAPPIVFTVEESAPYSKVEETIRALAQGGVGRLAVGFEQYKTPIIHVDPPQGVVRPEKPGAPECDEKRTEPLDRK